MTTRRVVLSGVLASGFAGWLLAVSSRVVAAGEGAGDPTAIMTAIYTEAIKTDGSAWLDPGARPKYLSKSLVALWTKVDAKPPPNGDVGPIDFDITADTNGLQLKSFTLAVPKASADTQTVAVTLGYQEPYEKGPEPAVVLYDFIREDGRWAIDDIHTTRWSVRDLLSRWLKEP